MHNHFRIKIFMTYLDFLQRINDLLFRVFGLNRVTLEFQIKINSKRSEKDIVDEKKVFVFDDKGGYVQ